MSKFKVGDRVVVYHNASRIVGWLTEITGADSAVFQSDEMSRILVHPKQCRRLIKKKKKEIWVSPDLIKFWGSDFRSQLSGNPVCWTETERPGWIRFIEAKEKK